MKNWRSTLSGAALAALSFLAIYQHNGGDLKDWKQWLIPAAAAALGYTAKDAGVTGPLKVAALACLLLPSCASRSDGTKTFGQLDEKQWGAVAVQVGSAVIASSVNQAALSYAQRQKLDPAEIGAAALNAAIKSGVIAYSGERANIQVTATK